MYQIKYFVLAILGMAVLLVMNNCNKDNAAQPEADAPALPPITTFVMNFDDFAQSNLEKATDETSGHLLKPLSKNNWLFAAANVYFWQTTLFVTLAVPTHSFQAAFLKDRIPEYSDGTWIWSYNFNSLAGLYHAELHGKIVSDEVEWEMYITKQNVYENFKWFTGKSKLAATEGTWTLNKEPQDPVPMLAIEWHRNLDDLTYDIKYINVLDLSDEKGSYIFNGVTNDTTYDAFYTLYHVKDNNFTEIKWNRISKDGQVKDTKHFGDEDWHCWDENGDDITCGN